MTRPRRVPGALRAGCAVVVVLALLAGAVAGVLFWLNATHRAPEAAPRCTATVDEVSGGLDPVQAENAALIAAIAVRRGLPARTVTIALATAMQESKLENIGHGDRDSVGLFQQRPSQGWGTVEQIMDPVYSTGRFYDGLVAVPGYQDLSITQAAQAVQRSAFPDAYAQHEPLARAFASALTGWSPAALTCTLGLTDGAGDAAALIEHLRRDLGDVPTQQPEPDHGRPVVVVQAGGLGADTGRLGWAVAQWAVAVAQPRAITAVAVADRRWERSTGAWDTVAGADLPAGEVRITL